MSTIHDVKITETRTVDARYCDGCGKLVATGCRSEVPHSHCGECDRDYCNACYGDTRTYVHEDVPMIPCQHCREALVKHPEYLSRLLEINKLEEALRQERWDIEKKIGKSSRRIFKSVKPKVT